MEDVVVAIGHGFKAMGHWLFIDKCETAASLLSLSFAINSIFTGLSLSRFNLCTGMKRKAVESIAMPDKFLERVELLGKDNHELRRQLREFSDKVDRYRKSLLAESSMWEQLRRWVTVCCAAAAFVLVAVEVKTRIGVSLVCPYLLFLGGHAIWVRKLVRSVRKGRDGLLKSMIQAETSAQVEFDMSACVNKLKANRDALSPQGKFKKTRKQRKAPPA